MKCEICNRDVKSFGSLAQHVNKTHNILSEEYYKKYLLVDCLCVVCSNPTPFINLSKGYQKTCSRSCSIKYTRKKLKENPELHKKFTEKVSCNMKELWKGDEIGRINRMTKTKQVTISNMSVEERSEKFGWLNSVPDNKREYYIDRIQVGLKQWHKDASDSDLKELYEKVRRTKLGDRYCDEVMSRFYMYRQEVRYLTEKTYKEYKAIINPNNHARSKNGWQLDHKYSIVKGFDNKIEPEIMASVTNLQILSALDNNKKSVRCDISIKELLL
jgi:hypothetical protein